MAKALTVEQIQDAIGELESTVTASTVADIVSDLTEALKAGMIDGDEDTWESGCRSMIEVITSNYL